MWELLLFFVFKNKKTKIISKQHPFLSYERLTIKLGWELIVSLLVFLSKVFLVKISSLKVFLVKILDLKVFLGKSLIKCFFLENTTSDFLTL